MIPAPFPRSDQARSVTGGYKWMSERGSPVAVVHQLKALMSQLWVPDLPDQRASSALGSSLSSILFPFVLNSVFDYFLFFEAFLCRFYFLLFFGSVNVTWGHS